MTTAPAAPAGTCACTDDERPRARTPLTNAIAEVRGGVIRVVIAVIATALGFLAPLVDVPGWPLFVVALIAGGAGAVRPTVEAARDGRVSVDALMLLAAAGAASIGAWPEGAILLVLFSLGSVLEEISLARTEGAVRSLMDLRPEEARVIGDDGVDRDTPIDDVLPGMRVRVRPGERLGVDARVAVGVGSADLSALTGESDPVPLAPGTAVPAGAIVLEAAVECVVERAADESTLARIIGLVADARERQTGVVSVVERWLSRYVLAVLAVTAVALVGLLALGRDFPDAFLQAMTLLVVMSPCALAIGLPATTLAGLAAAARAGVLVKGADALDQLGTANVVCLDKTGTLTAGTPEVVGCTPLDGATREEVLALAAAAEAGSLHPLAGAVAKAAANAGVTVPEHAAHRALPGAGVSAEVEGSLVEVLSPSAVAARGVEVPQDTLPAHATRLVVCRDGVPVGVLGAADQVRSQAGTAIAAMRDAGCRPVVVSGDHEEAVRFVCDRLGIEEAHAHMSPEDKIAMVRGLQAAGERVMMVGDGINDAPALAAAEVGIAMGGRGADQAMEAGDVVLMSDRIERLSFGVQVARATRKRLRANLIIGLGTICILVIATLVGSLPLPLGVLGHEGSTVIVTLNGLRLLAMRPPKDCFGPRMLPDGRRVCGREGEPVAG